MNVLVTVIVMMAICIVILMFALLDVMQRVRVVEKTMATRLIVEQGQRLQRVDAAEEKADARAKTKAEIDRRHQAAWAKQSDV